ncbi:MAG: 23S rRNA (guanosine(2251)-2'-O)-methyltransferase RlmB [Chlamydiota bacterium]
MNTKRKAAGTLQKKTGSQEEIVMGLHCIDELVHHYPKRLLQVFVQDSMKKNLRKKTLCRRLEQQKIPTKTLPKSDLEKLCGSSSHQGFVALIKKRQFRNVVHFLEKRKEQKRSLVLMLDQIQDPHNVGAIFRSAECFGVDGIVFSSKHGPTITPSVSKVSSGASEHLNLMETPNLESTMIRFQEEGYKILAASLDQGSIDGTQISYPEKMVLILGAEGEGVRSSIRKKADSTVYIPMKGHIHSLNVSTAAAVLLAFATRKIS